jgi:hypothetical protein
MMFVGSITAALCPDNATTRSTVNLHPDQMLAIGYCTPCAPQAPAGQVYVFLHSPHGNSGPGCPSGCGRTH